MSLEYIRRTYNVPAFVGAVIDVEMTPGVKRLMTIAGARGHYLRALDIDNGKKMILHPKWNIDYIDDKSEKKTMMIDQRSKELDTAFFKSMAFIENVSIELNMTYTEKVQMVARMVNMFAGFALTAEREEKKREIVR
jgi:hypothetical protein